MFSGSLNPTYAEPGFTLQEALELLRNTADGCLNVYFNSNDTPEEAVRLFIARDYETARRVIQPPSVPVTKLAWQAHQLPLAHTTLIRSSLPRQAAAHPPPLHPPDATIEAALPVTSAGAQCVEGGRVTAADGATPDNDGDVSDHALLGLPIVAAAAVVPESPGHLGDGGPGQLPDVNSQCIDDKTGPDDDEDPRPRPSEEWVMRTNNKAADARMRRAWRAKQTLATPSAQGTASDVTDPEDGPPVRRSTARPKARQRLRKRKSAGDRSPAGEASPKRRRLTHSPPSSAAPTGSDADGESEAEVQAVQEREADAEPLTERPSHSLTVGLPPAGTFAATEDSLVEPNHELSAARDKINAQRVPAEKWLAEVLAAEGTDTARAALADRKRLAKMVKAALALGNTDSLTQWQEIIINCRRRNATASTPHHPVDLVDPETGEPVPTAVREFRAAFRAFRNCSADGISQAIAYRITLAQLYEKHEAAVQRIMARQPTRQHRRAVDSTPVDPRTKALNELFNGTQAIRRNPYEDPRRASVTAQANFARLAQELKYGHKLSIIKQALGQGVLSLVPIEFSQKFFTREMTIPLVELWVKLVRRFNPEAIELGETVVDTLEAMLRGSQPFTGRRLRIESMSTQGIRETQDPTVLFDETDGGEATPRPDEGEAVFQPAQPTVYTGDSFDFTLGSSLTDLGDLEGYDGLGTERGTVSNPGRQHQVGF